MDFKLGNRILKLFDYIRVKVKVGMKNFHKQVNL